MDLRLLRAYLVELLGAFSFVYFAAGLTCINVLASAEGNATPLTGHQPGLVGMALGQGLVWMAMLAITVPISGGYLNPAISIMLWVMGRLSTTKFAWFVGAQILGGVLAGFCIQMTFDGAVLTAAKFGAPHLNPLTYQGAVEGLTQRTIWTGLSIELLLTFFVVVAIFATRDDRTTCAPRRCALGLDQRCDPYRMRIVRSAAHGSRLEPGPLVWSGLLGITRRGGQSLARRPGLHRGPHRRRPPRRLVLRENCGSGTHVTSASNIPNPRAFCR